MIIDLVLGSIHIPEADIIDNLETELQSYDEVLGTVRLETRRIWTVLCRETDLTKTEVERVRVAEMNGDKPSQETKERISSDIATIKLLREIFWQDIRDQFGGIGSGIMLRKGWKVVKLPPTKQQPSFASPIIMVVGLGGIGEESCEDDPICEVCGRRHRQTPEEPIAPPEPEDETVDDPLQPESNIN